MFMSKQLLGVVVAGLLAHSGTTLAAEKVTVDNFVRAETDMTLRRYEAQGAFGKMFHLRAPTPLDRQDVIRMNRDTLYSFGIFDLTEAVTITLPETDRWLSMMLVNQDHSIPPAIYDAGPHTITQDMVGTRYVMVIFRTLVDANDPADINRANAIQDQYTVQQASSGSLEVPDWDEASLTMVRDAINVLGSTLTDGSDMLGVKSELPPIHHLIGTAMGWGGNPKRDASYINGVPARNDGKANYAVTMKDVPVDGFWSITAYNKMGFMEPNDLGVNSINNLTATPNPDGGVTIHFGGCDDGRVNCIPITEGWNYIVRLYQPRQAFFDKTWTFPDPQPVD
jgi:hypothetical protein